MPRQTLHAPLCLLLSGLLLMACGGVVETPDMVEALGVNEAAVCSSSAVTSLTLAGISTYQGEMAGSGSYAVSYPANAAWMEYRIDGVLQSSGQRLGTSGSWYFSKTGVSCGSHTFNVKAWPRVVDSGGNDITCWSNTSKTITQIVTEPCPVVCGDNVCSPGENDVNCPVDCCEASLCPDGKCCKTGTCSNGMACML